MNFTFEALDGAKQALYRLKRHLFEEYKRKEGTVNETYKQRFCAALADDLDTPKAIALMWELIKDADVPNPDKVSTLLFFDRVLGIGLSDKMDEAVRELGVITPEKVPEEIQTLIEEREAARVARNWEEADRLREAINLKGYALEDTPDGPKLIKE